MGNAAAILNADKKRITHLDDELDPLDTVPPIIKGRMVYSL